MKIFKKFDPSFATFRNFGQVWTAEDEWNARKNGGAKWCVWRKIHIGIDERTLEYQAAGFTINDMGDAPMLPELIDQISPEQQIATVIADGAFDTRKCHDAVAVREAAAIIPPTKNAKPCKPDARGLWHATKSWHIEARRSDHLAKMERLTPPKSCGDQDALSETARPMPERTILRPSGRRVRGGLPPEKWSSLK